MAVVELDALARDHGTTLAGLMKEHGVEPRDFLDYVHDIDFARLTADPRVVAALDLPADAGGIYEIGGPDRVTYGDLMKEYARQRGLRRALIPVPLLTPRLSSPLSTASSSSTATQIATGRRRRTIA